MASLALSGGNGHLLMRITCLFADFIVNAQLVDESRYHAAADAAEQLQPVELILFCKRPELMPQVRVQPGDIILLRHAMVSSLL